MPALRTNVNEINEVQLSYSVKAASLAQDILSD